MTLVKNGSRGSNALGVMILLCVWGFGMIFILKDDPPPIDQGEKFQQQSSQLEQKKEKAASLLDSVKAYEAFLSQAEAEFKATKASDKGLEGIRKTLALFDGTAESLHEARKGKDALAKEDIAYLKGIEKRLSTLQQQVLPGLRLAFRKRSAELLWERDVSVSVSGTRNTKITFTAGMFATNANIKAVQQRIESVITHLRFKQTRFQWYKGAEGYTYFTIKTPMDAKLAMFKFGQFVDLATEYGP